MQISAKAFFQAFSQDVPFGLLLIKTAAATGLPENKNPAEEIALHTGHGMVRPVDIQITDDLLVLHGVSFGGVARPVTVKWEGVIRFMAYASAGDQNTYHAPKLIITFAETEPDKPKRPKLRAV
jgi:hypothetical protein